MPYVLGIDIGAGHTRAAVCRRDSGTGRGWGPPQPVPLGARGRMVSSALAMTPEGDVVPGDLGRRPAETAVGGYLRRVGDSSPMLFGGSRFPAHGLVAAMARWVVDRVWQQLDEPPERIALAYPSGWGNGRLHLVHAALAEADLAQTALVTRARAVVECHQAAGRVPAVGGLLLAFRIGGSTCEVTVAAPHGPGRLELLGSAELDEVAGFDVEGATAADARAVLTPTVDLAEQTVSDCRVAPGDLSAVLIAGGSASVYPHVSDLLAAAFPVPVLRDQDPPMTVAGGAALLDRLRAHRPPRQQPLGPAPADPPETATDAWPQVTCARPPRPPLAIPAVRTGDR
ncbi:molecular chaperone DnaK [Actinoplanes cyaneus]|uniref:hypothetical protein n=1 Tax=Actinoplanes cyaneus TaxID=52696 RepID=UPI0031D6AFF0